MIKISCAACNARLTDDVKWGAADDYDAKASMGGFSVPSGRVIRLSDEMSAIVREPDGRELERKIYSPAGALAVNPGSIFVAALVSAGMDNACCGSDGQDGPNRACCCGAIVATEWSDCWTQAEVRFLPDAVRTA